MALATRAETSARLDFAAGGMTVAQLVVEFGAAVRTAEAMSGEPTPAPAAPRDLAFEAMEGLSGRVAFASPPDEVAAMFPAASAWLGPRRVAALAASTLLVGMVCPGLHSIYGGLTVEACDEPVPEDRLGFRVVAAEPRFRSVRMTIAGGGLVGASRATPACRRRRKRRRGTWLVWSKPANSPAVRLWSSAARAAWAR